MTILFITHYVDFYGANKSMLYLILDLRERYKVIPVVLCPCIGPLTDELNRLNISYIVSSYYVWISNSKKSSLKEHLKQYYNSLISCTKIENLVKNFNVDIIHSNSSVINIGQVLSDRMHIPHVWHLREYGEKDYGLHYIGTKHYVTSMYSKANVLIAISNSIKDYYKLNICPKGNVVRIYNGIHCFKSNKHKVELKINFCCAGLITDHKNQFEIIKACRILKNKGYSNFVIHLIGDGDESYIEKLMSFIKSNNLTKNVKMWGFQSNVELILNDMDVGIMPSKNEAFGRVTVEYMMAGMPVIGANTGGTVEIIENCKSGFLYNLGDEEELVKYMEYFLNNIDQIKIMGNNAINRAMENFNSHTNTDLIYILYKNLIGC